MKTLFAFPGQGSQAVGMVRELATTRKDCRELLERADEVLGFSLSAIMAEGPEDVLKATENTQPALFVASQMAALALADREIVCDLAAGHSLGEYSALCAVGALSFEDGLRLVRLRGELMAQAGVRRPGAMAAVLGLDEEPLRQALSRVEGTVVPANFNCPGQIVISGDVTAVESAMEALTVAGARKVVRLPVSGAFHSPLMDYALDGLREGLTKATFRTPLAGVIANVDAAVHEDSSAFPDLLSRQLVSPVRWVDSMRTAIAMGVERLVEVGSGKVLCGLMRQIDRTVTSFPAGTPMEIDIISGAAP